MNTKQLSELESTILIECYHCGQKKFQYGIWEVVEKRPTMDDKKSNCCKDPKYYGMYYSAYIENILNATL